METKLTPQVILQYTTIISVLTALNRSAVQNTIKVVSNNFTKICCKAAGCLANVASEFYDRLTAQIINQELLEMTMTNFQV